MGEKIAYLDNACIGKVQRDIAVLAHGMISDFEELKGNPTEFTVNLYEQYEAGRKIIAETLGVAEDTICYVDNTSHGLGMIANNLPLNAEDNVLVCDLEFFSTVLCWRRHMERTGFEVREVKTVNGCVTVEAFREAADEKTKAIIVSAVQEINGYRVDLSEFCRLAKELNAWLIVDGIQEVGALNPHLGELDVDIYCAGGHKWLRNPFGCGFMYVSKRLLKQIQPDFYGYFNAKPPKGGWGDYLESPRRTPFDEMEITDSAARFETGATVNYLGAFSLIKSFQLLKEQGMDHVEKEILDRRRYLQRRLLDTGAAICGSVQEKTLSGICTFNLSGGWEQEKKLIGRLQKERVYCSLRYISNIGGIRVSPHYYTEYEEIDQLINVLHKFLKE